MMMMMNNDGVVGLLFLSTWNICHSPVFCLCVSSVQRQRSTKGSTVCRHRLLIAVVILHGRIQQGSGVVAASENPPLLWPLPSQVTLRSPQIIQLSPNWKCDITIPNSPSTILNDACGRYQAYVKAPD